MASFRGLIARLSKLALDAAFRPLERGFAQGFAGLVGRGRPSPVTPFAKGGVFNAPQLFGTGGGLGVLGEVGPEAVMPLARDGSGRLGVRAEGRGAVPNVTVNVSTPDAASFRRAQSDIAAAVAQAVARGQRNL